MKRIAILLFDDVDLLDVGGPYEVFLTADRLAQRDGEDQQFEVVTVSADGNPVTSYGGMGLAPSMAAADIGEIDVAVVPGAIAILDVSDRVDVQRAVKTLADQARLVSSVCTGAFLLGDQGLLADRQWTTHFEDVADLGQRIGSTLGMANIRWVDAGNVVTAGGLSSGLAMALRLVERLHSRRLAVSTARQLEYLWDPDDGLVAGTGLD